MSIEEKQIQAAIKHLKKNDPVIKKIIAKSGPCKITKRRNRFVTLARSIVSQQISVAAAKTINRRLVELLAPERLTAPALAEFDVDQLREAGISKQKATYLLDLSNKVKTGEVNLRNVSRLSDDDVIQMLCKVKGIGVWTAQMFLMFSLGRLDVLPTADLGIQNAMKKNYPVRGELNAEKMKKIASKWAPYRTIGCHYMWQSLDME